MEKKIDNHIFQGMSWDMGVSKHDPKLLKNAFNVRLTARGMDLNQLVLTNEKGTRLLPYLYLGYYLGHAILNDYLVLFTHEVVPVYSEIYDMSNVEESDPVIDHYENIDRIYRIGLDKEGEEAWNVGEILVLFKGDLNFDFNYPIETLSDYETIDIQKVYWVDGKNQPRMINIVYPDIERYDNKSFDFILELKLTENITVERAENHLGEFAPGTVQYAFSYYNLNGLQSNIFYVTPLLYAAHINRGGSPEDKCSVAFKILISNLDTRFDYLRVYSISRSAKDTTPYVKRIADLDCKKYKDSIVADNYIETLLSNFPGAIIRNEGDNRNFDEEEDWGQGRALLYNSLAVNTITAKDITIYYSDDNGASFSDITTMAAYHAEGFDFQFRHGTTDYLINKDAYKFPKDVDGVLKFVKDDKEYYMFLSDLDDNESIVIYKATTGHYITISPVVYDGQGNDISYATNRDWFIPNQFLSEVTPTPNTEVVSGDDNTETPSIDEDPEVETGDDIETLPPVIVPVSLSIGLVVQRGIENGSITNRVLPILRTKEIQTLNTITIIDTNLSGEVVDPKELIFIGGESIVADAISQKDGTLFLGNIYLEKPSISNRKEIKSCITSNSLVTSSTRKILNIEPTMKEGSSPYVYWNSLSENTQGFKWDEYYRLGLQFQYKTGKWSEPVWIGDKQLDNKPSFGLVNSSYELTIPTFKLSTANQTFRETYLEPLKRAGYVKVRPIVVFPTIADRIVKALGILSPTLFTFTQRTTDLALYGLASWVFRPYNTTSSVLNNGSVVYGYDSSKSGYIPYTDLTSISGFKLTEIQGAYKDVNKFLIDWEFVNFNTPEIIFDESLWNLDWSHLNLRIIGYADILGTMSDIDIVTLTPAISELGGSFIHKSFVNEIDSQTNEAWGSIGAGLYWDDYIVEDFTESKITKYRLNYKEKSPVKWLVYPWHRQGSLNNDSNRASDGGVRSAELKTKVISNLHYFNTSWLSNNNIKAVSINDALLFSSNLIEIIKVNGRVYQGNIDTLLIPDYYSANYFAFNEGTDNDKTPANEDIKTEFNNNVNWRTWTNWSVPRSLILSEDSNNDTPEYPPTQGKLQHLVENIWEDETAGLGKVGDLDNALNVHKSPVRMKYRSTPHITIDIDFTGNVNKNLFYTGVQHKIPIVELYKNYTPSERLEVMFGGTSDDALRQNFWFPAGEPVRLDTILDYSGTEASRPTINFDYGDTWFLRWDCLKTYAYTIEDPNQMVEIGSFMLESRLNMDGRYDRNRGLLNNTMMNPTNFNRFNPVYSQLDNVFNYQLLSDSFYDDLIFLNLIVWGNSKQAGDEIDRWTNITLASVYNLNGDKGQIEKLVYWKDKLLCFLELGISEVLFNSRVQVPTSDDVPIEIANNYKLDGVRYISEKTGCRNKFSVCPTDLGLYFIDSATKNLHVFTGEGINDLGMQYGMTTFFSLIDPTRWTPVKLNSVKVFNDSYNGDVYINRYVPTLPITENSLCYSEKLQQFCSFYPYGNTYAMFNMHNDFYSFYGTYLYQMFTDTYNIMFGKYYPYYITFIANPEPTEDKTFTNIDIRGNLWNGLNKVVSNLSITNLFDHMRVKHEFQDTGICGLSTMLIMPTNLKKKYGIWRVDVPRDSTKKFDRIRNVWANITFSTLNLDNLINNKNIEIHDISTIYYT